jgi:aconitase B
MGSVFTPELVRRDAEVTARLIEQVATHPASPPEKLPDAQTQALVLEALKDLPADDQRVVTPLLQQQKTPSTPEEARAFCAFYRSLFTTAMRGPDQTLRRFLAK